MHPYMTTEEAAEQLKVAEQTGRRHVRDNTLAAANIELAGAEFELKQKLLGEMALRRKLEPVLDRYDQILIDCPPSLGLLTVNALAAADSTIVPVSCEYLPIKGLEMLLDTIE